VTPEHVIVLRELEADMRRTATPLLNDYYCDEDAHDMIRWADRLADVLSTYSLPETEMSVADHAREE